MAIDRIAALLGQTPNRTLTGVDFIYVWPNQTRLDVFFIVDPTTLVDPLNTGAHALDKSNVSIYAPFGGEVPEAAVVGAGWAVNDGRNVWRLTTAAPGDFTRYRLRIDDPENRIDPYFNDVDFSFKANCESALDCAKPPHECAPEAPVDFAIDYTARDFWSLRQALLDFASERYPDWQDRLEADLGETLAELMAAMGDEFAYAQDRIAREAYLETASQRRSLTRHARLVDYHPDEGQAAQVWLDITVAQGFASGQILAGTPFYDGARGVTYEAGRGLADQAPNLHLGDATGGRTWTARASLNALPAHVWDASDTCLPAGSTRLFVEGDVAADLAPDDPPEAPTAKWALLRTDPKDPAVKARRWPVRVIAAVPATDPLGSVTKLTRIDWEPAQATPCELDLETLTMHGNLVPATAGTTVRAVFSISGEPDAPPKAVERIGPNGSPAYLFGLAGTDTSGLVWTRASRPDVRLYEAAAAAGGWRNKAEWTWRASFLGASSSSAEATHFTLDPGLWRRVAGYRRLGGDVVFEDYATGAGMSVRFGDGAFGAVPPQGRVFQAVWRIENGRRFAVAADTLTQYDPINANPLLSLPFVAAVSNPLAATGARDPESAAAIRMNAPEAFRAETFRAVRESDYADAAMKLEWVQNAGAAMRWTGSWLTVFATPDPKGAVTVSRDQGRELEAQLDRYRQAGREAYRLDPVYAHLDLEIAVCVERSAYAGDVEAAVLATLFGLRGVRPRPGFFSPDNFTFGTPLDRSRLEAAIQATPGVRAVEGMTIRRRGWFDRRPFVELRYQPAANEIIAIANSPLLPERGAVRLVMEGGA